MSSNQLSRRARHTASGAALAAAALACVAPAASAHRVSRAHRLQALASATAATSKTNPMPAAGKVLGGFTSQHEAIVLDVGKKDKRLTQVRTALNMSCTSGDQFLISDGFSNAPLAKNGSVSGTFQIPPETPTPGSTATLTGGTDSFSGKLNAKRATFSGTWDLHMTFALTGGQTDQCDSGHVTFKASL
jgi:hypothetical protein